MPKFTEGPWHHEVDRNDVSFLGFADGSGIPLGLSKPDCDLIAAAPDLYAALEMALPYIQKLAATVPFEQQRKLRQLQAVKDAARVVGVLAKARGED